MDSIFVMQPLNKVALASSYLLLAGGTKNLGVFGFYIRRFNLKTNQIIPETTGIIE